MITHDLGIVAEICDKVAIMYAGEIIEYGTAEDIYERKEQTSLYGRTVWLHTGFGGGKQEAQSY